MIKPIQTQQPKRFRANTTVAAATGAVVGTVARHALPTKSELQGIFNKENFDTFISNTAREARSANRSALKYAGIGAILASVAAVITNIISAKHAPQDAHAKTYSKYDAIIDAPDYACEILWYGD